MGADDAVDARYARDTRTPGAELLAFARAMHAEERAAGQVAVLGQPLAAGQTAPALAAATSAGLALWIEELEAVLPRLLGATPPWPPSTRSNSRRLRRGPCKDSAPSQALRGVDTVLTAGGGRGGRIAGAGSAVCGLLSPGSSTRPVRTASAMERWFGRRRGSRI
ncbi:hypothetical protein OTB16_18925 [Streptomyces sp. H27-S2]|nr:hypothetical protein [Streptomyces sp. H27-S2]